MKTNDSFSDTRKQVQQGWGAESGEKNWDDERQGEKLAKDEENAPPTPAEEVEEPDNSKSFSDYLAEKAARESLAAKPVRAPNEGVKEDKKWANAKEIEHKEEESYIQGAGEKAQRQKQRKEKNFLDVDLRYVEQPRSSPAPRGGRGGRGGDRAPRGDRPPRGAPRGGAPRGSGAPRGAPAGAPRGGRGGPRGPAGPTVDEKNFPSLGGN
jgi:plasminogen activator inhibitor 1 RNA-binding protein